MTQPPYDPTRQFQPPPQQYMPPPAGYPQPVPPYGPPPPVPKQKGGWLKIVGIVSIVVVGVCLFGVIANLIAGTGKPDASATRPAVAAPAKTSDEKPVADDEAPAGSLFNMAPGETMTITDDDGNVTETTVSKLRIHKGACGQVGADPDNGSYLIADVTVKQVKGTGSINPLYFDWVGDDGTTSNSLGGAFSGCTKNDLTSTNSLREGAKRSGQIAFDVKDEKGSIEYSPGGLGSDAVGSWKAG